MIAVVRAWLVAALDEPLVDELLVAYTEAKLKFYEGGIRLSEVEGGRFCEAAFRLLQQRTTGTYTPLGQQLNANTCIQQLANLPAAGEVDSVRLHIPRALRVVYDVRNNRDAARLGDGIDPNLQDATLVVGVVDWVLAEFVRLYGAVDPNEAQLIVQDLVTRRAPVVQDFDGFLKVLNPELSAGDFLMVLLYQRGALGASRGDLHAWVLPKMRGNMNRSIDRLVVDKAWAHDDGDLVRITESGKVYVESNHLIQPLT